jgi:hypothetical protein
MTNPTRIHLVKTWFRKVRVQFALEREVASMMNSAVEGPTPRATALLEELFQIRKWHSPEPSGTRWPNP